MTSHRPRDDGPEPVPPAELLRLRNALVRGPRPAVRAQHLAAATAAVRQHAVAGHVGRFASRGARVAAAVVASLAITSGLAGAQLLPQPAQRLLSNVSDRFAPSHDAPPATPDELDRGATPSGTTNAGDPDGPPASGAVGPASTDSVAPATTPTTAGKPPAVVTTAIPGPTGPGSPDDPTDPGPTDPGPTTTTTLAPGSTTTTTGPGSTTTTTTVPGTSTTTTTEASSP